MPRFLAIAVFVCACSPGSDGDLRRRGDGSPDPGVTTTKLGSGWTTTDPQSLDCSFEPSQPVVLTEYAIQTQEDFAFDGVGRMLYQSGSAIVASGPKGGVQPVGAGPADPSGLAMLSPSELVIASPDSGSLVLLDLASASSMVLIGGLDQPNGVETGWDGLVYVTERVGGRVLWVDPADGASGVIAQGLIRPNGLALDAGEDHLYVAAEDGVYVLDRITEDWSRNPAPKKVFGFAETTFVGTVEVDACGYLYTVDFASGKILRIDPDSEDSLLLADLDAGASFGFGSLEFGNGGGWSRSTLFTSNRRVVTGVEVGIPGVLAPSAP